MAPGARTLPWYCLAPQLASQFLGAEALCIQRCLARLWTLSIRNGTKLWSRDLSLGAVSVAARLWTALGLLFSWQ